MVPAVAVSPDAVDRACRRAAEIMQQIRFMVRPGGCLDAQALRSGRPEAATALAGSAGLLTVDWTIWRGDGPAKSPDGVLRSGDVIQVTIGQAAGGPLMAAAVAAGRVPGAVQHRLAAVEAALYRGIACVTAGGQWAAVRRAMDVAAEDTGAEWTAQPVLNGLMTPPRPMPDAPAERPMAAGERLIVGVRLAGRGAAVAPAVDGIAYVQTVMVTRAGAVILTRIGED